MRASLLIMAVGAVGTSLATERTLLIRRHVSAHPCRVNTLHGNDYTQFLSHTHTNTHKSHSHACSLSAFFININMQIYKCLTHINTNVFMYTHIQGIQGLFFLNCDRNQCNHCSSSPITFFWHLAYVILIFGSFPLATLLNHPIYVTDAPASIYGLVFKNSTFKPLLKLTHTANWYST